MLQIRLNRAPSTDSGGGLKPLPVDTVTVACPDHLVIADLPVAKGIGAATFATAVKTLGRRSRRQLGERVHFCVRCDFPIAIYGRLSPCDHAFCLDCARSDSICYLCDERIQKIQTIKLMEGIFICAAPHCLKSFLKRTEFESHILENHAALIEPNADKEDGNESEAQSTKQQTPSESAARGPARSVVSPASNSQFHDREEKARLQQPWDQMPPRPIMPPKQPFTGQVQNFSSEAHLDINRPPGFDLPVPHNPFQQSFDTQGTPRQESGQFSDKQQGVLHETFYPGYPSMHSNQPPNFVVPLNSNSFLSPQVGVPPFPAEGGQPFYGTPYEMGHISRPDKAVERGPEPGSLLGFPPGAAGGANFSANYPQPWTAVPAVMPFESVPGGQGMPDGYTNMSDAQGKVAFYQGDYGRNPGGLPMVPPLPPVNRPMEAGNSMDPRDGKGILAPQPMPHQAPPPPPPPHLSQHKNKYHSGDMGRDGRGFGWQHENRDGFGGGQD